MTRSTPPLKQHLLTRSDLARMAVPAGEVLSWLGSVAIEQVGSLPADGAADPVFTVLTPELRADLAARLTAIGKTDVVLAPEHVRSFLARVLHAAAPGVSATRAGDGIELKLLLQETAAATAANADADALRQMAREETQGEELAPAAPAEDGAEAAPAAEPDVESAEPVDELAEPDALDACFDLADLEAVVGGIGANGDAAEAAAEPPPESHAPGDEPAMTEEPAPIEVEHVNDAATLAAMDAAEAAIVVASPVATQAEPGDVGEPVAESVAEPFVEPTAEPIVERDAEPAGEVAAAAEPDPVLELAAAVPATVAADENGGDEWTPIERVEGFLVLLKDAVLELAQRPVPQQFDMRPFVLAMQAGLDRSTQQAEVTATAMETLQVRVDGLGERLADVAARPVPAPVVFASSRGAAVAAVPEADPVTTLMAGVAVLALAWSVLFWITLDAPRLAAGTLVGANVIGCLLLSTWWRR